jgi:hypothetical protein
VRYGNRNGTMRAGALLERLHALELGRQERLQLRDEVDDAPLVILRGPGVEAERAGIQVELTPL